MLCGEDLFIEMDLEPGTRFTSPLDGCTYGAIDRVEYRYETSLQIFAQLTTIDIVTENGMPAVQTTFWELHSYNGGKTWDLEQKQYVLEQRV